MTMQPTTIGRRRDRAADPYADLRADLSGRAEVRAPGDAEEPILAPGARAAVFDWMSEINGAEDLKAVGLKPRSTALLFGPPGCGKTTLAHHLAARLGIPMVLVGSENIMAKYLGESEKIVADLFDTLEAQDTPCLLFMDEIEAIGGHRSKNTGGGADNARTSILTVLLRRVETYGGMLMAATNRPEDLDPALWRRFHMQITVDLPGDDERFAILKRYAAPFELRDEDLDVLVDLTAGASPALLRVLMEGMKRLLVLAPRTRRDVGSAADVLCGLAASAAPPPEIAPPPLWDRPAEAAEALAGIAWPPKRG